MTHTPERSDQVPWSKDVDAIVDNQLLLSVEVEATVKLMRDCDVLWERYEGALSIQRGDELSAKLRVVRSNLEHTCTTLKDQLHSIEFLQETELPPGSSRTYRVLMARMASACMVPIARLGAEKDAFMQVYAEMLNAVADRLVVEADPTP